jgi:hypothetical protein
MGSLRSASKAVTSPDEQDRSFMHIRRATCVYLVDR